MKYFLITLVSILLLPAISYGDMKNDYPELMVVPKASERLQLEELHERRQNKLRFQWPLTLAGLTTLTAGIMQSSERKDEDESKFYMLGILTGVTTLGFNVYQAVAKPYRKAYRHNRQLKATNNRTSLIKERMAEEEIHRIARNARTFIWVSSIANFTANILMLSNVKTNTSAQLVDIFALIFSMAPIIFDNHRIRVSKNHDLYKKRIYGPIVSTGFLYDNFNKKSLPGVILTYRF